MDPKERLIEIDNAIVNFLINAMHLQGHKVSLLKWLRTHIRKFRPYSVQNEYKKLCVHGYDYEIGTLIILEKGGDGYWLRHLVTIDPRSVESKSTLKSISDSVADSIAKGIEKHETETSPS